MLEITAEVALSMMRTLTAVAIVLSTAERLAVPALYSEGGLLSWKVLRTRPLWASEGFHHHLEPLFLKSGFTAVLWSRLMVGSVLLLPGLHPGLYAGCLAIALLATCIVNYRCVLGGNGSDQMTTVLTVALFLAYATVGDTWVLYAVMLFAAAQSCLAYFTAGVAKVRGPVWRQGDAVLRVFATRSYGLPKAARWLAARPLIGKLLTWNVVVMEVLFPLVLVVDPRIALVFLGWGVLFHAMNAAIMGLNVFFWSFLATYPAILVANGRVREALF